MMKRTMTTMAFLMVIFLSLTGCDSITNKDKLARLEAEVADKRETNTALADRITELEAVNLELTDYNDELIKGAKDLQSVFKTWQLQLPTEDHDIHLYNKQYFCWWSTHKLPTIRAEFRSLYCSSLCSDQTNCKNQCTYCDCYGAVKKKKSAAVPKTNTTARTTHNPPPPPTSSIIDSGTGVRETPAETKLDNKKTARFSPYRYGETNLHFLHIGPGQ